MEKMEKIENIFRRWGGFLETLQDCQDDDHDEKDEQDFVKNLKMKIRFLEFSRTVEEVRGYISYFSEEERNYLNSPLLDEIFDTIKNPAPFYESCAKNKRKALEFYLKKRYIQKTLDSGLFYASLKGHKEIVKLLLERGANVHADDDSALRYADNIEILELLLKNGANVNVRNGSALKHAVNNDKIELVKILLKYDASIRVLEDTEFLANILATCSLELVQTLMASGLNRDVLNRAIYLFTETCLLHGYKPEKYKLEELNRLQESNFV